MQFLLINHHESAIVVFLIPILAGLIIDGISFGTYTNHANMQGLEG